MAIPLRIGNPLVDAPAPERVQEPQNCPPRRSPTNPVARGQKKRNRSSAKRAEVQDHPLTTAFLDHLTLLNERWHSNAKAACRHFCQWLHQLVAEPGCDPVVLNLSQVTPLTMAAYVQHLESRYSNRNTQRSQVYALRRWFRYLQSHGHIKQDPSRYLQSIPRQPSGLNRLLTPDAVSSFFQAIHDLSSSPERDLAMFGCMASLGLRPGEVLRMTAGDLDPHAGMIKVHGKGNRDRLVPLHGPLLLAIERYVSTQMLKTPGDPIWQESGLPISPAQLRTLFHRYREGAGVPREVGGPHVFRHFFITQNLLAGADLRDLAAVVGHTSVRSLETYFHVTTDQLRAELITSLEEEEAHAPPAEPA